MSLYPKLFEIDAAGRLTISPECLMLECTKDIITKYPETYEPYLAFCHLIASPNSPLRNLPEEEKWETAIIEVNTTIGEFDDSEPLIIPCIKYLKSYYTSAIVSLYECLEEEVHSVIYYLKTTPISSDDYSQRVTTIEKAGKLATSLATAKKQAEQDMAARTRGDQEAGTIR